MWISSASSRSPKIEPEKSLPLRPSVVWSPRASRAMNPVMIKVAAGSFGVTRSTFARDSGHRTAGPNARHSTSMTSRASTQCTAPARRVMLAK